MATAFLLIIYASFISLGLPDSLLGACWPVMRAQFGAPIGYAGIISAIITCGTILSSLLSGKVLGRFGTGRVTFVSVLMTALALLGFSWAPSFWWLALLAVPLGLGAGAVDSGLNGYVAAHYKAHHMSWLHCFWGIGAMLGPVILSGSMGAGGTWRRGYLTISLIQLALTALLLFTLPLWKRVAEELGGGEEAIPAAPAGAPAKGPRGLLAPLGLPGVKPALVAYFFYCGAESTMGLWGGSYLVSRGLDAASAAAWVSLFYGGITAGRLLSGFVTMRVSNKNLIRLGQGVLALGAALLFLLPVGLAPVGFLLVGAGCAPIYPCMLHETPARFGKQDAQSVMGFQMAVAYTGAALLPPLFGALATRIGVGLLPLFVFGYAAAMALSSERVNAFMRRKKDA